MLNRIKKIVINLFFRLFYLSRPSWDTGITPPELEAFIANHPPGRAIDLGCGTGTNVIALAKHGWEVRGVDFVPKAIRLARRKARAAGFDVSFRVGDVTDPAHFQGQYDLIYDIGCYHSIDPVIRSRYHQLVAKHLSPDGTYLLYGFLEEEGNRIREADVEAFQAELDLKQRENCTGTKDRPSAWFWFGQKAEKE